MRKVITTITLCSIIFSTSIVYGQNKQVDLEKKLTENRNSQLRLDEQIIELNSKIIEVEEKILSTNEEISKLDLQINEIKSEINELESEIEKIAAQSVVNGEGQVISSGSWPVPGHSRISSPYGYRIHPIFNTKKMHTGIDIPAPTGTPAVAIDSGKVIFSGTKGGYGNTVMIQHDDGKVTLYGHNSKLAVSVGQRVEKGQVVSKIGSTGNSSGPHLHFEVRINGKHVNPVPYIK